MPERVQAAMWLGVIVFAGGAGLTTLARPYLVLHVYGADRAGGLCAVHDGEAPDLDLVASREHAIDHRTDRVRAARHDPLGRPEAQRQALARVQAGRKLQEFFDQFTIASGRH